MTAADLLEAVTDPGFAAMNGAYVMLLLGAFCRSLNWIRSLLVLAALCFVVFAVLRNIPTMVLWNVVIGGLNLQRLAGGLWREAVVPVTMEHETLRRSLFPHLPADDFHRLWRSGTDRLLADAPLSDADATPSHLYVVIRGSVAVKDRDVVLDLLGPGAVVGPTPTAHRQLPAIDWEAVGAVWLRCWDLATVDEPEALLRSLRAATDRPLADWSASR